MGLSFISDLASLPIQKLGFSFGLEVFNRLILFKHVYWLVFGPALLKIIKNWKTWTKNIIVHRKRLIPKPHFRPPLRTVWTDQSVFDCSSKKTVNRSSTLTPAVGLQTVQFWTVYIRPDSIYHTLPTLRVFRNTTFDFTSLTNYSAAFACPNPFLSPCPLDPGGPGRESQEKFLLESQGQNFDPNNDLAPGYLNI